MDIYVLIVSRSFHVVIASPLSSYIPWGIFYSDFQLAFILQFSTDTWNAEEHILLHHAWSFMGRLWSQVQWEIHNLFRVMQMTYTLATLYSLNPRNPRNVR